MITTIDGEDRFKCTAGYRPGWIVVAMGVPMCNEEAVHELKEMARHPEAAKRLNQSLIGYAVVE